MKNKIYVITHKDFKYNILDIYQPIFVGNKKPTENMKYIYDSSGDNIANKNENYCELTAIYWIWKNIHNCDNVGIVHYRRYFVYGFRSKLVDDKYIEKNLGKKHYDIVLPYKFKTKHNVYRHFIDSPSGKDKDLINLRKIIAKKYPEYLESYDYVMSSRKASYCNMMISSKKIYNSYCAWLFDILFDLEKITDLTGYTQQQKRIYGFLSEFLLNVYVAKNDLRVKYCSMYFIDNSKFKNFLKKVKLGFRSLFLR